VALKDIVYVQDAASTVEGFSELYSRHARDVWRYALGLSGDPSTADDLTAEAFARIWEARGELRVATAKAYLLAIVRNLFLSQWRRASRQTALDESLAERGVDFEARERAAQMLRALQHLTPQERSLLLLRAEEGLSYAEMAEITGATEGALRLAVHRARARLKELMEVKR
jgi:RNA polymerase sigma-70 factor (ECF subfamily)